MTDGQLLVCTFAEARTTQRILDKYFGARPDGTILFDNNYFKASVSLRINHDPEHDLLFNEDDWKRDLPQFPAVVLVSSDRQPTSIASCKTFWDRWHTSIGEGAVRVLFVDGEDMNEHDTYELVAWAVKTQIEVVNLFLCREDAIDISVRLKRVLECAPWSSTPNTVAREEESVLESQSEPRITEVTQECPLPDSNLLNPTRLRRGLQKSDVSKLVDDLLLADDADSDT